MKPHHTQAGSPRPADPGGLAGALTGLTFVAAIVGAMRLAKMPLPRPGAPAAGIRAYYTTSSTAVRFSVTGQLISILSLAQFTAAAARLARASSRHPQTLQATTAISGAAAVTSLAISAITHASLTRPAERDDEDFAAGARRVFAAGGPVHGVAYSIFVGALTLAARDTGLLGRRGTALGLASAAAGTASPLYYKWEGAGWLIPIGRFSGYLLSGIVGTRIARPRHAPPRP